MEAFSAKSRLAILLEHFSVIEDPRECWRVAHPLPEVLLLVVCATIASCDDFDDIAAWGEAHLDFLRRLLPFHHGVPSGRWLNILMNRIDPELFSTCFMAWARTLRDDAPDLIALDGKTLRRSHDRCAGKAALHLVSAFATREKLVLGQEAVADKSNETTAIPALLERLATTGALTDALVTIDAIACTPKIAGDIVAHQADYLLAVKDNQPTLHGEIRAFFDDPRHDRQPCRERQGPWARRVPPLRGLPRRRLDDRKPALPGRIPLSQNRRHHQDQGPRRAQETLHLGRALLHHLPGIDRRTGRQGRARPLADRKRPPLGPRRHLQGRSRACAERARRSEHGHRQALRHQYRAKRKRQKLHKAQTENRWMGYKLPRKTTHRIKR